MNIQLALDRLTIRQGVHIAGQVSEYVDWIEVGTSLIKEFGMESVRELRKAFPRHTLVADMITMDNAVYEFEMCYAAGADIATVMGVAPPETIEVCARTASKWGKTVMIDLLDASDEQMIAASNYQEAIFCFHVSKDQQELEHGVHCSSFAAPLYFMEEGMRKLAIAGGITADSIPNIKTLHAHAVIIGSAIIKAENPVEAANTIRQLAEKNEEEE